MNDDYIRRLERRIGRLEDKIENVEARNRQLEKIIRSELDVDVDAALEDDTPEDDDSGSDEGFRPP